MVAEGAAPLVAVAAVEAGAPEQGDAIVVRALEFGFPPDAPVLKGVSLTLPRGSRCLLTGANGAGKTTLLQVLAGKYLVNEDTVRLRGDARAPGRHLRGRDALRRRGRRPAPPRGPHLFT
jgi:ABC-type multidrug transport system fused ATPase/permease subunit